MLSHATTPARAYAKGQGDQSLPLILKASPADLSSALLFRVEDVTI